MNILENISQLCDDEQLRAIKRLARGNADMLTLFLVGLHQAEHGQPDVSEGAAAGGEENAGGTGLGRPQTGRGNPWLSPVPAWRSGEAWHPPPDPGCIPRQTPGVNWGHPGDQEIEKC